MRPAIARQFRTAGLAFWVHPPKRLSGRNSPPTAKAGSRTVGRIRFDELHEVAVELVASSWHDRVLATP